MKLKSHLVIVMAFITFFLACKYSSPQSNDSEMTLLMRKMYDDIERIKIDSNNVENLFELDHNEILKAKTTESEKSKSPEFHSFSLQYLATLDIYKESFKNDRKNNLGLSFMSR